jgi:hydroxymethylbilane synthase
VRAGTRASRLARWQTEHMVRLLRARRPDVAAELITLDTAGDRDGVTPLPEIGGKGVFTAELERALRAGEIDFAVHSLKDLPVDESPGLVLAAVGQRADPRDVLIARAGGTLDTLPRGATVGTCSTRRGAQLLAARPDLALAPLRGNVDTRVRKARDGACDAVVIAAAGVQRLGLEDAITEYLPLERMLPAPGQAALAVQCRADDAATIALLRPLDEEDARAATDAERAFLAGLGGGCAAPIAAHATVTRHAAGATVALAGLVASPDGRVVVRVRGSDARARARALGLRLAAEARDRGAQALLT